jgi:hypothetical protein
VVEGAIRVAQIRNSSLPSCFPSQPLPLSVSVLFPDLSVCNLSPLLCQARVKMKTRLGLWLGAGNPMLLCTVHNTGANLLICEGATVRGWDGRVGHGEWQQFLCSCSGGARDPQTRVGHQRVCEPGSQSASRDPALHVQYHVLCCLPVIRHIIWFNTGSGLAKGYYNTPGGYSNSNSNGGRHILCRKPSWL